MTTTKGTPRQKHRSRKGGGFKLSRSMQTSTGLENCQKAQVLYRFSSSIYILDLYSFKWLIVKKYWSGRCTVLGSSSAQLLVFGTQCHQFHQELTRFHVLVRGTRIAYKHTSRTEYTEYNSARVHTHRHTHRHTVRAHRVCTGAA